MERSTTFTGHVQVYHNRARAAFGLRGWLRPCEHKCATMRLSENACVFSGLRTPSSARPDPGVLCQVLCVHITQGRWKHPSHVWQHRR